MEPGLQGQARRARQEMRTRSDANLKLFDQGYIGFTLARIGTAHVHRCAGLSGGIVEGTAIRIGDCIQTGPKGGVRLQMLDRDDFRGAGPTRIVIGPNSELCFNKFLFHFGDSGKLEHKNLVDLVLGSVKVFFKGWGRNSTVSIKTGATICGVRGSEVIVRRERTDGAVQVGVIEGHAWLGNRTTRQIRYLKAGNWAQDQATGLSQVSPMSRADWNRVVQKDGLGLGGAISGSGAACERILGRWKWSNGNVFVFSADHRWNRPGTQFRGNWRCQTNRQGQSEVRITPDQGSRWTVVRIAPDGLNMSGIGDNGRPARAMRLLP